MSVKEKKLNFKTQRIEACRCLKLSTGRKCISYEKETKCFSVLLIRNDTTRVRGYLTIERDLTLFNEVGELNLVVGWEQLDDGNGIARTLDSHYTVWQKSCRDNSNETNLSRKKTEIKQKITKTKQN